jgi:hypothetical protein
MHTREKLFGTLCKCMACAAARQERLELEALKRHCNEWRSIEDQYLEVHDLEERAEALRSETDVWKRELLESVRQELAEED